MGGDLVWIFQGGRYRTVPVPATAGNAQVNLTPTAGKRWLVLRGRITCVNDATVATRNIALKCTDGTNPTFTFPFGAAATASTTHYLNFGPFMFNLNCIQESALNAYIGVDALLLEGADLFQIGVVNGVAGDSFSGWVDILEIDI